MRDEEKQQSWDETQITLKRPLFVKCKYSFPIITALWIYSTLKPDPLKPLCVLGVVEFMLLAHAGSTIREDCAVCWFLNLSVLHYFPLDVPFTEA